MLQGNMEGSALLWCMIVLIPPPKTHSKVFQCHPHFQNPKVNRWAETESTHNFKHLLWAFWTGTCLMSSNTESPNGISGRASTCDLLPLMSPRSASPEVHPPPEVWARLTSMLRGDGYRCVNLNLHPFNSWQFENQCQYTLNAALMWGIRGKNCLNSLLSHRCCLWRVPMGI